MERDLFNLNFYRWEIILLCLIPAFINIIIFFYSFLVLDKTRTTTYFSIFVLLLGFWQACDGLMKLSETMETAHEWNRIAGIFVLVFIPVGIFFILCFAGWHKTKYHKLISLLLFFPVVFFLVIIMGKIDKYEMVKSSTVYWIVNPQPTLATFSVFLWVALGALAMITLLWVHYFKSKKRYLKNKQALWLASGLTFPVIGGVLFEIFYPLFFNLDSVPLTAPLLTIFSVTSLIAIKKYKMLTFLPKHQWEQVVESMNEGLVIVDLESKIQYANKSFCDALGYEFNEISGKMATDLFLNDEQKLVAERIKAERKLKKGSRHEMPLKTKDGKIIWMSIGGSPYFDRKGKVIGSISVQANITGFKEAAKILEHNEMRLNKAQEVAHVGNWELNFETGKAIWSDEACKMYGLSPEEKYNQSFESWIAFVHPEDLEGVKKEIARHQADLSDSSFKHRIVWKNGIVKHIHSVSKFEFNDAGKPIGLFGICHDITEGVLSEKALNESETNMRTFINESLMSIYFVDPVTKKIGYANPALSQLLGYSLDELKAITPYDFVNHSRENIEERMREVIKNKRTITGEREWKRKDGKIVHVLVNSFYHEPNGSGSIYVAAQDITDSVKQKKQIEFDQSNRDALINSTTDLMWSIDKDIKLITANQSFISMINAMTGITLNPGDSPLLTGSFPKQILKKWEQFYKRALSGETFTIQEHTDVPAEIYTEITLNPIFQDNKVIGAACYSRNITKSKLDELERNKITDDLIRRNKDLEQFSYIISHNLRAPVATILGLSTLVQTKKLPLKTSKECIKGLELSAKKLDDTIIDLNNILKVRGQISEKKIFVDLSDIVCDIKDNFRAQIEKEEVIIKIDFSDIDELFTVKSYLYSIFYNLISNSIKYRKSGEIPVIEIKSLKQNNNVILIFKDNGMGIDLNLYGDKVFGLYKRFHLDVEGKGMGLFMVKTQIETLGGSVTLKSEVDKGTEIMVEFQAA